MAISYIDGTTGIGGSATLPLDINAGDYMIGYAFRSNTGSPTLPSGWTSLNSASANGTSFQVGYKVAVGGGSDTSGTWTSATCLIIAIYRGVSGIGTTYTANTHAASTTINIASFTMQVTNGTSWVIPMVGSKQSTSTSTPSGLTARQTATNTAASATSVFYDTGPISSFPGYSITLGASAQWQENAFELLAAAGGSTPTGNFLQFM